MLNFGRFSFVVTIGWTWYRIVSLLKGAVTVFATEPAIPPQKSCFSASIARESFFFSLTGVEYTCCVALSVSRPSTRLVSLLTSGCGDWQIRRFKATRAKNNPHHKFYQTIGILHPCHCICVILWNLGPTLTTK